MDKFLRGCFISEPSLLLFVKRKIPFYLEKRLSSTPLCIAADKVHTEVAKELIQAGCRIGPSYQCDNTPMLAAIYSFEIDIVKLLIRAGADVYEEFRFKLGPKLSPLYAAMMENALDSVECW